MSDSDDRQETPSTYRVSMARGLGMVPLAPALVRSISLGVAILIVSTRAHALADGLVLVIQEIFRDLPTIISGELSGQNLQHLIIVQFWRIAEPLIVVFLGTWVALVAIHQLAAGGSWTPSLALPNFSRVLRFWSKFDDESGNSQSPLGNRIAIGLIRPMAAVIGCLSVAIALRWSWDNSTIDDGLWSREIVRFELLASRLILTRSLALLIMPLLVLGLFEWFMARRLWLDRLRPSSEEARREIRELEGDPELKLRRRKLANTIRELGKIEQLLPSTEAVIVGTTMTGLSIQLVRLSDGRWAAGEVLRGTTAARFAEKCAACGKPWVRDSMLSSRLAKLMEKSRGQITPLPVDLAKDIKAAFSARLKPAS